MNCKQVETNVSAYVDQELGLAEIRDIRGHLFDCPACAKMVEEERHLKHALRSMKEAAVPEGLEERLMKAVFTEPEPVVIPISRWIARAAVVFVAFFGGWFALQQIRAANVPVEAAASPNFEISRDHVYQVGADPTQAGPMVVTSSYGAQ
jgi:anti-sigma factor RsiW